MRISDWSSDVCSSDLLRLGDQIAILRDGEIVQQGSSQDIVLRPADDYIASFVKEVNRGRVIRVASAMRQLGTGDHGLDSTVHADTKLEAAVRVFHQPGLDRLEVDDAATTQIGTPGPRKARTTMVD